MADQIMTGGANLSVIVPQLWSPVFYPTLLATLPFNDTVARDYEGSIAALGDTVNVASIPSFSSATDLGEDVQSDAEAVTVAQTQLVVNKQLAKDFIVTDKALMQSIDAVTQLRDLAIYSVGYKMNALIIAAIIPSASAPDHQVAYTTGSTLALADLIVGKKLLDGQNVPDDGRRNLITDSPQYNDIFNITSFVNNQYVPNVNAMSTGAIQQPLLGFKARWTTTAAAKTYMFHPAFMQIAIQKMPEVKQFDLGVDGRRGQRWNVTMLMGLKQFSNVRVVQIG